jgi:hypothetical protein
MLRENRDQEGQDELDKALAEPSDSRRAFDEIAARQRILAAGGEVA